MGCWSVKHLARMLRFVAKLTAAQRNALPDSAFAGPGRTYPVPDASHAQFAKAMAARHAGPAAKKKIDAKANRVLDGSNQVSVQAHTRGRPAKKAAAATASDRPFIQGRRARHHQGGK